MTLSIILVNFNTCDYLLQSLASIKKYIDLPSKEYEVIVVDNASQDDSVKAVHEHFPKVRLIKNPQNTGYAHANNLAMKQAKGDYIFLINSDAELTSSGKITTLLAYMDEYKRVAVVTPKVMTPDGSLDWACHRGFPTPWSALTYFSGLEKMFPSVALFSGYHQMWKSLDSIHTIDACSGAAMIVRKTAIDEVGLFDERFFMYAEDIDWCYRFKEHKWDIVFHPGVTILHHKYKSGIGKTEETQTKRRTSQSFYDTMIQFYEKHYTDRYPRPVFLLVTFGIRLLQRVKGA